MSENQNNQGSLNGSESPLPFYSRRSTGNPEIDAIYYLADSIRNSPNGLQGLSRAPRTSQSQYSQGHDWTFNRTNPRNRGYRSSGNILDDFENGIKEELLNAVAGGDFRKGIQGALSQFTKEFGFELNKLPNMLGRYFGKGLADSKLGKAFCSQIQKLGGKLLKSVFNLNDGDQRAAFNALKRVFGQFTSGGAGALGAGGGGGTGAGIANGSLSSAELKGLAKGVEGIAPVGIALAVFIALMKPVLEGIGNFLKSWTAAFNRDEDMRKKRLANAQERVKKDMEMLAKEPFNILIDAAKEWESTWDETLKNISLTQGYTKENVYALYESVAKQLTADGFGNTIPATDVIKNLNQILETGLSGAVAEAFAYQSTWLSAVIPTEDFTSYAATYAQLASDAMNSGLSQAQAIEYANLQLQEFASNLLYSSRTLTGGFTTGLKDAASLFKNAVDIAQTARTHNVSDISGTLTAVSGVIGAVAPDLAQGLVQNVVNAAIGGNETSIVALRSLAGINAGNTEFLRQMATDPQGVFEQIFRNLGNMQKMSPTNYMEVAEGLSSVFGVDMQALARVDFNQLADKIADMQVNQASLEENLALFQTGESTLTKDQLRYQEINNDILENGLAYVIDNEYGRMIQEHMWEEQIANELAETEYAVNLQGAALSYLEGLRHTVANILSFLNPLGYVADGIARVIATNEERKDITEDIAAILEAGRVGGGNATVFSNLTNTTGAPLNLTDKSYLTAFFGGSNYNPKYSSFWDTLGAELTLTATAGALTGGIGLLAPTVVKGLTGNGMATNLSNLGVPITASQWNTGVDAVGGMDVISWADLGLTSETSNYRNLVSGARSSYSGFGVGKSDLLGAYMGGTTVGSPLITSATAEDFVASMEQVQAFIDSAQAAAEAGMMYSQYWETANSIYGIADAEAALRDFNVTEEALRGQFEAHRSGIAGQAEEQRKENIQQFIEENRGYWDYASGSTGIFQTAMWLPFFGDSGKFDLRVNDLNASLVEIQQRLGDRSDHTVISGIEELSRKLGDDSNYTVISVLEQIESHINTAFIQSPFQQCLEDWLSYITSKSTYQDTVTLAAAWADLQNAEEDKKNETLLALANAMNAFSEEQLKELDPQLQANVLLGKIIIILEAIMQQNNSSIGGFGLGDSLSALGMGMITK